MNKQYLADGVYVQMQDETDELVLTTEDGISLTNRIILDSHVLLNLLEYIKRNIPNFWAAVPK